MATPSSSRRFWVFAFWMMFSVFPKKWVLGYSWSTLLWHQCYYLHRSRDALSPVCGIFHFIIKILSLAIFYEIPGTRVSLLADMNSSEISLPLFYQWAICFANFKCITCRFYNYILMNIALCILNSSIYGQKIDLFMWNFSPSFSCFSRKYLWSTELVKTICETAVFSSSESFPNYMQSMVSL